MPEWLLVALCLGFGVAMVVAGVMLRSLGASLSQPTPPVYRPFPPRCLGAWIEGASDRAIVDQLVGIATVDEPAPRRRSTW